MSILTFPLPYIADVDETSTFATTSVVFSNQKKQVQRKSIAPLESWKITVKGDLTERDILKTFWNNVGGNTDKFYFVDPTNTQRLCRFSENKLSITDIREFSSSSATKGTIVGFTCDITIELAL